MRTRGPGESTLLLLDAAEVLAGIHIDYAVIGAVAGAVHGVVRASVDADAILATTLFESSNLVQAFEAAGLRADLRRGDPDDPIRAVLAISDNHGNRVDFLIGLRGVDREVFARSGEVEFRGERLRVVCREDFVALKIFAGGPQDLADAHSALAEIRRGLDTPLLRRLVGKYGPAASETLEGLLLATGLKSPTE